MGSTWLALQYLWVLSGKFRLSLLVIYWCRNLFLLNDHFCLTFIISYLLIVHFLNYRFYFWSHKDLLTIFFPNNHYKQMTSFSVANIDANSNVFWCLWCCVLPNLCLFMPKDFYNQIQNFFCILFFSLKLLDFFDTTILVFCIF